MQSPRFNKLSTFKNIAKSAIHNFSRSTLPEKRKWKPKDHVMVLAYAWIKGFSVHHASEKLNAWIWGQRSDEPSVFADGREERACPHQTSVNDWLRTLSRQEAEELSDLIFDSAIAHAFTPDKRKGRFLLEFDPTYLGYWGKRRDGYIKGSTQVKGTRHIRHYHAAMLHGRGFSLFVGLHHIKKHDNMFAFMKKVINRLHAMNFKIKFVLADSEYYCHEIIDGCKKLGVYMITPAKEYNQLKKLKKAYLEGEKGQVQTFKLGHAPKKGKKNVKLGCWVCLHGKDPYSLSEVKKDFQQGNLTLKEAMKKLFGLLTTYPPQFRGNAYPYWLKTFYKMRWQIETGFRDYRQHSATWRTNHDPSRFFLELGEILLYNTWRMARLNDPRGDDLTFLIHRDELIEKVTGVLSL